MLATAIVGAQREKLSQPPPVGSQIPEFEADLTRDRMDDLSLLRCVEGEEEWGSGWPWRCCLQLGSRALTVVSSKYANSTAAR